jgi:hypothetical protein
MLIYRPRTLLLVTGSRSEEGSVLASHRVEVVWEERHLLSSVLLTSSPVPPSADDIGGSATATRVGYGMVIPLLWSPSSRDWSRKSGNPFDFQMQELNPFSQSDLLSAPRPIVIIPNWSLDRIRMSCGLLDLSGSCSLALSLRTPSSSHLT